MNTELTNNAKNLLKELYSEYQNRRANGTDRFAAMYFEDAKDIYNKLYAEQDIEDLIESIRELSRVGLMQVLWASGTATECRITNEAIAYMENRFKRVGKELIEIVGSLGSIASLKP